MRRGRKIVKLDNQEAGYISLVVEIIAVLSWQQSWWRGFLDELEIPIIGQW